MHIRVECNRKKDGEIELGLWLIVVRLMRRAWNCESDVIDYLPGIGLFFRKRNCLFFLLLFQR